MPCVAYHRSLIEELFRRFDIDTSSRARTRRLVEQAVADRDADHDPCECDRAVAVVSVALETMNQLAREEGRRATAPPSTDLQISRAALTRHGDVLVALCALTDGSSDDMNVIVLSACYGLSADEVGTVLSLPPDVVRCKIVRGVDAVWAQWMLRGRRPPSNRERRRALAFAAIVLAHTEPRSLGRRP